MQVTYQAMWQGIRRGASWRALGDIGHAIARHACSHGYSVVKEYCGHGIGQEMHEEPQILDIGHAGTGMELQEGMVGTIEPMLNSGQAGDIRPNSPTNGRLYTRDGKLSAQFEHTVAVTGRRARADPAPRRNPSLCAVDAA